MFFLIKFYPKFPSKLWEIDFHINQIPEILKCHNIKEVKYRIKVISGNISGHFLKNYLRITVDPSRVTGALLNNSNIRSKFKGGGEISY